MEIVGIVSNHPQAAPRLTLDDTIPFHHFAVAADKADQEARIRAVIEETGAELVNLARYIQVLSDDFSAISQGAASISTTRSCPASRAPSPVTSRMSAA